MISIIINCWNNEGYIEQAIKSAMTQVDFIDPYEVFVVDDGSIDSTMERVRSLASKIKEHTVEWEKVMNPYANLYLLNPFDPHEERHKGCGSRCFNYTVPRVVGDIIVRLDGDDFLFANALAITKRSLIAYPEVDILSIGMMEYHVEGDIMFYRAPNPFKIKDQRINNRIVISSPFRKKWWKTVGGMRELEHHEDWHFWNLLVLHGAKVNHLNFPFFAHRYYPDSQGEIARRSQAIMEERAKVQQAMREEFDKLVEEKGIDLGGDTRALIR